MANDWKEWPYGLDWDDAGRAISVVLEDGSEKSGTLYCEDVMTDDDGDEWPFWAVEFTDRPKVFWAKEWRFTD